MADELTIAAAAANPWTTLTNYALNGHRGPRWRQAAFGYTAGLAAWNMAKQANNRYRNRFGYILTVGDKDDIYDSVHEWLMDHVPAERLRSMKVRTQNADSGLAHHETYPGEYDDDATHARELSLHYDDPRPVTIDMKGHKVKVSIKRQNFNEKETSYTFTRELEWVEFATGSKGGRDAVLEFLTGLATARSKRTPRLCVAAKYGWNWSDLPTRDFETVVLPENEREWLINDLKTFLGDESVHVRMGMPWHRGYLLHGPPGTGKTSIGRAMGTYFGLDVYFMSLSALGNDVDLMGMMNQVPPKSILLLEDVDVAHAATVRDDSAQGISLSALLNVLDGVVTPHGLITIMTTNKIEMLDEALLRPGRSDVTMEVGYLDQDQLRRLVTLIDGGDLKVPKIPAGMNLVPSAVIEELKRTLHEPKAVRQKALENAVS